jgi:phage gp37-like protein
MIGTIEDAIIARLTTAFAGRVREVDHKPAKLDAEELNRILTAAPAAYVALLGWQRQDRPEGTIALSYGIYLIAANASGERARRRGDAATIGAYEMAITAAATLERWVPAGAAGPIEVRSCENLFGAAFEKAGRTVYGLVLELPASLDQVVGEAPPGDFITFNGDWDIPPFGDVAKPPPAPATGATAADAVTRVTLPAAP